MTLPSESDLDRYAELAVKVGVNLQAGQRLLVRAPVEAAPLVRKVSDHAYRQGARLVDVMWNDDALTLSRFRHAPPDSFEEYPTWRTDALLHLAEAGAAFLTIYAEDPDLLAEQDSDRVNLVKITALKHLRPYYKLLDQNRFNWCAISVPLQSWAAKVFPDTDPSQQIPKLWQAIFKAVRVDQPDPIAAWQEHIRTLSSRESYLNDKQFTALRYRGPETDLTVGLPPNHRWLAGQMTTAQGIGFTANMPTEEVFTLPHREQVDGVVVSTKPLSYSGVLIRDFGLKFEGGQVTKAWAKQGEAALTKLLDTDEGARRLGEVALVPHSSPISQSGLMYYNTLFDENASCHFALGKAYQFCLAGGAEMALPDFVSAGGNDSLVHVDFMMGSGELDVDGLTVSGQAEPVLRAGEWA